VKNITVSVDEAVYHAARVTAAQHRTSVSAMVRAYLAALADGRTSPLTDRGESDDRRKRQELVELFEEANLVLGYPPGREGTYAR